MGLVLVTPPTLEPVTIDDVIAHLRLEIDSDVDEDVALSRMISASRRAIERNTGTSVPLQTWRHTAAAFPAAGGYIALRRGPVQSATVTYLDTNGDEQTLTSFVLESSPQSDRISLADGATWPTTAKQADAVRVEYVAGYASDAVPDDITAAILLGVEDLYRNRGAQTAETLNINRRAADLVEAFRRDPYDVT